jgi:hypothetical protein
VVPRRLDVDLGGHLVDAQLQLGGVREDRGVRRHGARVVHLRAVADVDVVALVVLLERLHPELVGQRQDVVLGGPDEGATALDDRPALDVLVEQPATDPVARLHHENRPAGLPQRPCRDQAGQPASDHDHVDLRRQGAARGRGQGRLGPQLAGHRERSEGAGSAEQCAPADGGGRGAGGRGSAHKVLLVRHGSACPAVESI